MDPKILDDKNQPSRELRTYESELRAVPADPRTLRGYAAVFNALSVEMWGFSEMIAPGAFSDTLEDDIRALWNHDTQYLLGRTTNETLTLSEDERGLKVSIELPQTSYADDVLSLVQRGDLNQMSFGFFVEKDTWTTDDKDQHLRTIEKVRLLEVSPVTFPAYPQTSIEARQHVMRLNTGPTAGAKGNVHGARDRSLMTRRHKINLERLA